MLEGLSVSHIIGADGQVTDYGTVRTANLENQQDAEAFSTRALFEFAASIGVVIIFLKKFIYVNENAANDTIEMPDSLTVA